MFGTMCKPLHAGKAAINGLRAARLASRGFTSRPNALECEQGFADTQSTSFQAQPVRPDPDAPLSVEANLFKYHAACYLTHSPIEAVAELSREHQLQPDDVTRIKLIVPPGHLKVCNIPAPTTGLEIKFSLRHTAALAFTGGDTAALETYSDEIANRPELMALREKVEVETKTFPRQSPAEVEMVLTNGAHLSTAVDVGEPATDLDDQWKRLTQKFHSLADPILGTDKATACIDQCASLMMASDLDKVLESGSA